MENTSCLRAAPRRPAPVSTRIRDAALAPAGLKVRITPPLALLAGIDRAGSAP